MNKYALTTGPTAVNDWTCLMSELLRYPDGQTSIAEPVAVLKKPWLLEGEAHRLARPQ